MIAFPSRFLTASAAWSAALLAAVSLLSLAACDSFDTAGIVETCVTASMKHGEPFGNAKEKAESQAQFRQYCEAAANRRR